MLLVNVYKTINSLLNFVPQCCFIIICYFVSACCLRSSSNQQRWLIQTIYIGLTEFSLLFQPYWPLCRIESCICRIRTLGETVGPYQCIPISKYKMVCNEAGQGNAQMKNFQRERDYQSSNWSINWSIYLYVSVCLSASHCVNQSVNQPISICLCACNSNEGVMFMYW